jgi:hypothetical protein
MIATSRVSEADDGLEILCSDVERSVCCERQPNADGELKSLLLAMLIAERTLSAFPDPDGREHGQ